MTTNQLVKIAPTRLKDVLSKIIQAGTRKDKLKMDREFFKGISIIGRETYAILCAERYLENMYPDKDWKPITNVMWEVVSCTARDEWAYSFCDIIPEYLFEADNYELGGFDNMTKSQYDTYTSLLKDTDENVNVIFTALYDIVMDYAYTSISEYGEDTLEDLEAVCGCLEEKGIALPDKTLVAFSSFSECNGWGHPFEKSKVKL